MLAFKSYAFATRIFRFVAPLYLQYRIYKKKENSLRIKERYGYSSCTRPEGKLIWIHTASVGEAISALALIKRILLNSPDTNILLTTGTLTSANLIVKKLPDQVIHQFFPLDVRKYIKNFLNHWRPSIVLFFESEWWPNFLTIIPEYAPLLSINTRVSDRSFKKWQKHQLVASFLLKNFALFLPQSKDDEYKIKKLTSGDAKTLYVGNLKYDAEPLFVDYTQYEALQKLVGKRKVIVAASLHLGEEKIIFEAIKPLFNNDIFLILVPRHIENGRIFANYLESENYDAIIRSKDKGDKDSNIYIADTMGELGIFYKIADIVIMGGSFVQVGGHNPIEAAHFHNAIIMGPEYFNFKEIVAEFTSKNAMITVNEESNLTLIIQELLNNESKVSLLASNAEKIVKSYQNISKDIYDIVMRYTDI